MKLIDVIATLFFVSDAKQMGGNETDAEIERQQNGGAGP
jgi:hypothetical protein